TQFYFRHFLRFCLHIPLFLTLVLLALLVTRRIGVSFGVHLLLGHEDFWRQFFGGMFVAFLAGECLLLGFVFDEREAEEPSTSRPGDQGAEREAGTERRPAAVGEPAADGRSAWSDGERAGAATTVAATGDLLRAFLRYA